ncbi:MAG TPA: response regulator transcription factor [Roseiflexaceae bacterium]|nr:response regulator transcription factor [Roseiflexaceae bacterium]
MSERILLVEDDATTRRLLASGLASAGYQVTDAPDGETAVALLAAERFDLVITDIRMRRVDGVQVLQAARQQPQPAAVILLTGYSSVESAVAALRLGAYDYLQKPCALPELLERAAGALRRREEERRVDALRRLAREIAVVEGAQEPPARQTPAAAEALERIGRLAIDRPRHQASFDGRPLRLTPIEYALLCCLADAQGRVVSYEAIVRRTHGLSVPDDEAQTLIRSHIHNLRHKLDPSYIVGVRGAGYMLQAPEADR